jgi:cytidine deaminase
MIARPEFDRMLAIAKQAAAKAYCQYSQFPVGAALLMDDGQIIPGCNVENVSFGLTNCAERTAVFSALAQGFPASGMRSVLIYIPGETLYSPCGACRQVLKEFLPPEAPIYATCDLIEYKEWTLAGLLPDSFDF